MAKIPFGIVITTSEATKDFFEACYLSLPKDYHITIHTNTSDDNGWELAGIQRGKDTYDEFVHLMDTTILKDVSLIDKLFEVDGNVFLTNGGYHYMGKFVSSTIPELPKITTKEEAIRHELHWLPKPHIYFTPDLPVHTDVFDTIYGQRRMRLENDFIIKWKGTFHI